MTASDWAGIDEFSLCQKDELIEECHNVTAGLMDGEYNRSLVILSKVDKTVDNVESIVGIETYRKIR
jgi:hypothetical protein